MWPAERCQRLASMERLCSRYVTMSSYSGPVVHVGLRDLEEFQNAVQARVKRQSTH
jgi:hypothetical protein